MKYSNFSKLTYWYRYVDDNLTCSTSTDRQLNNFLTYINFLHKNIEFIIETEQDNTINFLHLSITKKHNKYDFSIYNKPSHTDITIHNSSAHPI